MEDILKGSAQCPHKVNLPQVGIEDPGFNHDKNSPVPIDAKGYHGRNEEAGAQPGINHDLTCTEKVQKFDVDVNGSQDSSLPQVAEKDLDQNHDENLPVPSGTKGYHGRNEDVGVKKVAEPGCLCATKVPESGIYVKGPDLKEEALRPELKGTVEGGLAENRRLSPEAKGLEENDKEARADTGANEGLKSAIYVKSLGDIGLPQGTIDGGLAESHHKNRRLSLQAKGPGAKDKEARADTCRSQRRAQECDLR